jgi:hypothetical protein
MPDDGPAKARLASEEWGGMKRRAGGFRGRGFELSVNERRERERQEHHGRAEPTSGGRLGENFREGVESVGDDDVRAKHRQ